MGLAVNSRSSVNNVCFYSQTFRPSRHSKYFPLSFSSKPIFVVIPKRRRKGTFGRRRRFLMFAYPNPKEPTLRPRPPPNIQNHQNRPLSNFPREPQSEEGRGVGGRSDHVSAFHSPHKIILFPSVLGIQTEGERVREGEGEGYGSV